MRMVNLIHGFLPLVASLFFLISVVVLALRKKPGPIRHKRPRAIIAWPIFLVTVTYSVDCLMLLFLLAQGKITSTVTSFLDNAFFSFTSDFSWNVLLAEFTLYCDCYTSLFPLGGYAALYLTTEALLLVFRFQPASLNIFDIIQVVRLGVLLTLIGVVTTSRASRTRPKCMDEENVPLQNSCNHPSYGSIPHNDNIDIRSQNNRSFIEYAIPRVKRLVPLVSPKNRPYILYLGVLLSLLFDRILIVLCPLQIGRIINTMANNGYFSWGEIIKTISVVALTSSEVFSMVQSYLWFAIEQRSNLELKRVFFDKALNVSGAHSEHASMDNLEDLVKHGKSIQIVFRSIFLTIIPLSTDILLGVGLLYSLYGAYMAMIPTLIVVTSLWSFTDFQLFLKRNHQQIVAYSSRAQLVSRFSGFIWHNTTYASYMPHQKPRYSPITEQTSVSSYYLLVFFIDTALKSILMMVGIMGGCMIVAIQVFMKLETIDRFVTLLIYLTRLGSNVRQLERGVRAIIFGLIDTNCVHGLFSWTSDWTPDASGSETQPLLHSEQGTIKFTNVHFIHEDWKRVLNGVSFEVPGNTMVALVGATGSGKTTILELLLGLYGPLQGSITVDGHNSRDSATTSFLAQIGFASQSPLVTHDTVLKNVLCANPLASDEEIYGACKAVELHEKFDSFPRGYQTILGEAAIHLSGSELQRLALARVVVKNPKFVILDEATSCVDSNMEALIQRNLKEFFKGKTIIVAANRLSTVAKADKIVVLRHGRVCEQGTHTSLLEAKGYYHSLWSQQSKSQEVADLIDMNSTSGPSKSTLKPDAPEFVPTIQNIYVTENYPRQDDDEEHLDRSQAEGENETPQGMLDANNDGTQEPVGSKKGPKRKHSRRVSSIIRQTSNSVVVAYPKKARKTTEGSKKRPLRRHRNESEPIG